MSLKGDKYENAEETRFRLENTVVLYDKKPVYISRVGPIEDVGEKKEIARVYFLDLPMVAGKEGKETRKYLSSRNFDLSPFSMGYMNYKGQATFVSRTPVRQNKQGLNAGTTLFTNVAGRRSEVLDFNSMLRSPEFIKMFEGKYPSFQEAGGLIGDGKTTSVAISKMFAFSIDDDLQALFLFHKNIKCGISMKGDKALKIAPKFHFLREEMEECRIPIA